MSGNSYPEQHSGDETTEFGSILDVQNDHDITNNKAHITSDINESERNSTKQEEEPSKAYQKAEISSEGKKGMKEIKNEEKNDHAEQMKRRPSTRADSKRLYEKKAPIFLKNIVVRVPRMVLREAKARIRKSKGRYDASGSELGDESTWSTLSSDSYIDYVGEHEVVLNGDEIEVNESTKEDSLAVDKDGPKQIQEDKTEMSEIVSEIASVPEELESDGAISPETSEFKSTLMVENQKTVIRDTNTQEAQQNEIVSKTEIDVVTIKEAEEVQSISKFTNGPADESSLNAENDYTPQSTFLTKNTVTVEAVINEEEYYQHQPVSTNDTRLTNEDIAAAIIAKEISEPKLIPSLQKFLFEEDNTSGSNEVQQTQFVSDAGNEMPSETQVLTAASSQSTKIDNISEKVAPIMLTLPAKFKEIEGKQTLPIPDDPINHSGTTQDKTIYAPTFAQPHVVYEIIKGNNEGSSPLILEHHYARRKMGLIPTLHRYQQVQTNELPKETEVLENYKPAMLNRFTSTEELRDRSSGVKRRSMPITEELNAPKREIINGIKLDDSTIFLRKLRVSKNALVRGYNANGDALVLKKAQKLNPTNFDGIKYNTFRGAYFKETRGIKLQ